MSPPPRRSGKIPWAYLLLEASLIVFSVLLGFGISEWRQERADLELAERALTALRHEATANRDELQRVLENHEQFLAYLQQGSEGDPVPLRPAILRNSAWDTAQATGATIHLDYAATEKAAELSELQGLHRDAQIIALQQLFNVQLQGVDLPSTLRQGLSASAWAGLVGLEKKLLAEYDEAVELWGRDDDGS